MNFHISFLHLVHNRNRLSRNCAQTQYSCNTAVRMVIYNHGIMKTVNTGKAQMLLYACVSYISVAGTKYHDHSKLEKEELIWTYSPREIRVHHGGLASQSTGKMTREGSREITSSSTSMRQRMGGKRREIINIQSPPLVPYFLPKVPHLLNQHHHLSLWRTLLFKPQHMR